MKQNKGENKYEQQIEALIETLEECSKQNKKLQYEKDKIQNENQKLKEEKENIFNQLEETKKTVWVMSEQNKQLQYKISTQEKTFQKQYSELNENMRKVIQQNQSLRYKLQSQQIFNENIQDEIINEQTKDQTMSYQYNIYEPNKQGNDNQTFSLQNKQDTQGLENRYNINNSNYNANIQGQSNKKYAYQTDNSSKTSINDRQELQDPNIPFTIQKQNERNTNNISKSSINSNNHSTMDTSYSSQPQKNVNALKSKEESKIIPQNIEQLKKNESSQSISISKLDFPSNTKQVKDTDSGKQKVNQNSNIQSSLQSASPQAQQNFNSQNREISAQQISTKQKLQIKQVQISDSHNQKQISDDEEELNLTDEEYESEGEEIYSLEDKESYQKKISSIQNHSPQEYKQKANYFEENSQRNAYEQNRQQKNNINQNRNQQNNSQNSQTTNHQMARSRKIFEQNPQFSPYSQKSQISKPSLQNQNPIFIQQAQNKQNYNNYINSQIPINNQTQIDNSKPYYVNSDQNQNEEYNKEKHSFQHEGDNFSLNDQSEQQHAQIIYTPDKNNLDNPLSLKQHKRNNYLGKESHYRNTQENQSINFSEQQQQDNTNQRIENFDKLLNMNSRIAQNKSSLQNNQVDNSIHSSNSGQIQYESHLPSGENIVPKFKNMSKQGHQSEIDLTGLNETREPIQRVQIKSPKNMIDISQKNQFGNELNQQLNKYISQHNLIENFFILSADQTTIKERVMTENEEQLVGAETIYCYPNLNYEMQQNEKSIHSLAFPKGVSVKQRLKTRSQSDLFQIVMHDKKKDLSSDGFVFTLKTEQSYIKSDNSNKSKKENNRDVFEIVNPNRLLYCVCIKQKTFIDFKDKTQIKSSQNKLKKEYFYEVDSIYCIITKFPDIQFFVDVLENILNYIYLFNTKLDMIKVSKSERLGTSDAIECDLFYYKKLQDQIEAKLQYLVHSKIPLFDGGKFSLPKHQHDQKPVNLIMKSSDDSHLIECVWGLGESLRRFQNQTHFIKLYISLLLEQSVVFVSQSRTILSQFILIFHSLLQPLKWPHPMIITLPQVLNELLYSPTPMIIGINESKKYLDSIKFTEKYPDFNIVYLDEFIFYYINDPKEDKDDSDFINILNIELDQYFRDIQNTPLTPRNKSSSDHLADKKKYWDNIGQTIIKQTQEQFHQHIVQYIPKNPIFKSDQVSQFMNLDYNLIHQEINKSKKLIDKFLEKFFRTQIFTLYLEEYYGIV